MSDIGPRCACMADISFFDTAHRRLRLLNVTLERQRGDECEYRVKPTGAAASAWERLEDAERQGLDMAAQKPFTRASSPRKHVYRSERARIRALCRRHNRRHWAALSKLGPSTPLD
jgi:hypothetical protein